MNKMCKSTAPARHAVRVAALVTAAGFVGSYANAQTSDWMVPGVGAWSDAGNWSAGVPNAVDAIARILNGGTAEVNGSFSVGGLEIGAGSRVRVLNGRRLSLYGDVENAGLLELRGVNAAAVLGIEDDVLFTGAGELFMAGGVNTSINRIDGVSSTDSTLTNGANHTIRAMDFAGLGHGNINIHNEGLVVADGSGESAGEFLINGRSNSVSVVNAGVMRAEHGGVLSLSGSGGTRIDNTGGLIEAMEGSTVRMVSGADITGGVFRTEGDGVFRAVGGGHRLHDITLDGLFVLENGAGVTATGVIDNAGRIRFDGVGAATSLFLDADLTLTGAGEILMAGGVNTSINRIDGVSSTDSTLTNSAGHTIRALDFAGLGHGNINIHNEGLIVADGSGESAGEFLINGRSNSVSVVNAGIMRAEHGGVLSLSGSGGTDIDNAAGVIEALEGSTVRLVTSADIAGGVFRTEGDGAFRAVGGGHRLHDITLDGLLILENGAGVTATGVIDNAGRIRFDGVGAATSLFLDADLTLTGAGEILMAGGVNTSVNRIDGVSSTDSTLTNGANHTIRAMDFAGLGHGNINIHNLGLIVADGPGNLLVDGRSNSVSVVNAGVMRAENGGVLSLSGSGGTDIDNAAGVIEALADSTVRLVTSADIAGGVFRTEGTGAFRAVGGGHRLRDIALDGLFVLENGAGVTATGVIDNAGRIRFDGVGAATSLSLDADLTLAGAGDVFMAGGLNTSINRIDGVSSTNSTLTNGADHTIRAMDFAGLGHGAINIHNEGLIVADGSGASAGEFLVNGRSNSVSVVNDGVMRAENGGVLSLSGSGSTRIDNTGGVIEALADSTVRTVSGGQFVNFDAPGRTLNGGGWTTHDGVLDVAPSDFDLEISNADITIRGGAAQTNLFDDASSSAGDIRSLRFRENNGAFTVADGAQFSVTLDKTESFTNSGALTIGAGSSFTLAGDAHTLHNQSGAIFGGAGTLVGSLDSAGAVRIGDAPNDYETLTITGDASLGGEFRVDVGASSDLLSVGGSLDLGGALFIHVVDDALLSDGDEFLIATTGADLLGDFASLSTNSTLYTFETVLDRDGGAVMLISHFIPTPGAGALLAFAGLALSSRRRRYAGASPD